MKTYQKALFGGALMTAGISANAQQFIISDNDTTGAYPTFAVSDAYNYGGSYDIAYAPSSLNTSDTETDAYGGFGTSSFSTTQTSNLLRAEGSWDGDGSYGYGYGSAYFQVFFQTNVNADLILSWDVSGTDAFASAFVLEDPSGTELASFDGLAGDPLSGSISVPLSAGVDYAFIGGLTNSGFGPYITVANTTQFVQAELVPAPGAAGLLGAAGLAAARRRRR